MHGPRDWQCWWFNIITSPAPELHHGKGSVPCCVHSYAAAAEHVDVSKLSWHVSFQHALISLRSLDLVITEIRFLLNSVIMMLDLSNYMYLDSTHNSTGTVTVNNAFMHMCFLRSSPVSCDIVMQ